MKKKLVPMDDKRRCVANSALPAVMVGAGMDAFEQAQTEMQNYVAGKTTDWDDGMIVVAIYRAMTEAAPME